VDAQAHHIVPCGCPLAAPAQRILKDYDINIDSAVNGVWMSQKGHSATFRRTAPNSYYDWINAEIEQAARLGGKQGVLDFLARAKQELGDADQYARSVFY
jgi:hypothetical protein